MNVLELIKKINFPNYIANDKRAITRPLREITLRLRDSYYHSSPKRNTVYSTPFGGSISDSIGPWPEFILRGLPCQKSKKGCCTPCFYSRMPQVNLPEEDIYKSLIKQTKYILDNFNKLVLDNQKGVVTFEAGVNPISFVLTPTGSFFDQFEFPTKIRNQILELLNSYSKKINRNFALHIETHAEHFLIASSLPTEFNSTIHLLKKLNSKILFGFESRNNFVRNILYNKYLDINTFENAVELAKSKGIGVGAFVFIGINPLTDVEIIADAIHTLNYLKDKDISPILMFHNVQPYTIQELLYIYHAHKMLEPRTLLEIIYYLLKLFPDDNKKLIDPWLIADPIGGPPPPQYHIFNSGNKITCEKCSKLIHSSIVQLRKTRNRSEFFKTYDKLLNCECSEKYFGLLENQIRYNNELLQRTKDMVGFAERRLDDYVNVIRPIINPAETYDQFNEPYELKVEKSINRLALLKADLLCYGLRVEKSLEKELMSYNSYIHEAGFVHAAHFFINGHLVNTCIEESFCKNSPYILRKNNGNYELARENISLNECKVLKIPSWCHEIISGIKIGDILRPHNKNVLSGMTKTSCYYFQTNEQCKFCSLGPLQSNKTIKPGIVAQAALRAYENNNKYELSLSGGTAETPDRTAEYFSEISKIIREKCDMRISVELVPPDNFSYIDKLYSSGVNAIIMNIEIWPDDLRRFFCPGKSKISKEYYLESIQYAISKFGKGQVASVLIAGLQSKEQIIEGCNIIIDYGAIPTIIPFKPFNDCQLNNFTVTNSHDLMEIYPSVSKLLNRKKLSPDMQPGCTGCGGCSLENI